MGLHHYKVFENFLYWQNKPNQNKQKIPNKKKPKENKQKLFEMENR